LYNPVFLFFAMFPNPYLSPLSITRGDNQMIRERINSSTIRAASYDHIGSELIVESNGGSVTRHAPVPYDVYHAIASSRFMEKIHRHFINDHVVPAANADLWETYPIS
jgi:hypothetical protein